MTSSKRKIYPSLLKRLFSVWYRHVRVYLRHIISNGFPPFIEPLLFLAAIGLGLGRYIDQKWQGMEYIAFLGTGLLVTSSMWTSAFECSFGTFIRMEFEKVYDGMLASPVTVENLMVGEILWAASKGCFFSFAVMFILAAFDIVSLPHGLIGPLVGFFNAMMFACLSLFITSFVKTINHFNFYMTGVLSPMFFFSGVVFPIENLPAFIQPISHLIPLTHSVKLVRAVCTETYSYSLLLNIVFIILFTLIMGTLAVIRLKKRMIS